jgi:predicted kinase
MQMKLILMRGISGSGKSTYLKKFYSEAFRCSADDFFTFSDGSMEYDHERIKEAHQYSRNACLAAMKNKLPMIAVDNSHIKKWEFEIYLEMAKAYDYQVEIIRLVVDPIIAQARNIHKNTLEYIEGAEKRMEPFYGERVIKQ